MITACVVFSELSMDPKIPIEKAPVLPVPDWACPITLRP